MLSLLNRTDSGIGNTLLATLGESHLLHKVLVAWVASGLHVSRPLAQRLTHCSHLLLMSIFIPLFMKPRWLREACARLLILVYHLFHSCIVTPTSIWVSHKGRFQVSCNGQSRCCLYISLSVFYCRNKMKTSSNLGTTAEVHDVGG